VFEADPVLDHSRQEYRLRSMAQVKTFMEALAEFNGNETKAMAKVTSKGPLGRPVGNDNSEHPCSAGDDGPSPYPTS
jgi:hypothetical protein